MRRWFIFVGIALVVLAGVYVAGLLPERAQRIQAEQRTADLQARLDEADARLRANRILGDLLMVMDVLAQRNFGQAQALSSALFDRVGEEVSRPHAPALQTALAGIQARRDDVTAGLARTDPAVGDTLRMLQVSLRTGLGYPVP